ncbi:Sec-independent protein translocase protein TatB [Sphingobium sp. H39-3-25]|uniref:Sec-independent protein translocase protein TatB n=1 Tax=Sphingobium arseniciresistens TaxID=3030834 RepID=UPI0023B98EC8|nr:Sec-independent protein translocase protein TatB [Sphingobium arseniciresistens]
MLDIGSSEFLLIVIVAVVVIGPKDLPRALYKVGQIVGKARGMARHFRTGIDAMVREVELEELEKKWAAQNERIMREHSATSTPAQIEGPVDGDAARASQYDAGYYDTAQNNDDVTGSGVSDAASHDAPAAPAQAEHSSSAPAADASAPPVQSAFPYDVPAQPATAPVTADQEPSAPAASKGGAAA